MYDPIKKCWIEEEIFSREPTYHITRFGDFRLTMNLQILDDAVIRNKKMIHARSIREKTIYNLLRLKGFHELIANKIVIQLIKLEFIFIY